MQRFRFRLSGLLRLRAQLEREARRSLATAMGDVAGVEQRLATAESGLRECEDLGCTAAPHAPLARAMAQGLVRHRLRLQNELRAAAARLERARGDWVERKRDERTLQLLRDRRHAEWSTAQQAHEQHEIEELARQSRATKSREERP